MSIFKETFRDFVQQQLKLREYIVTLGSGTALSRFSKAKSTKGRFINTPVDLTAQGGKKINVDAGAFYTNTVNRSCVARLSSGVDLRKNAQGILEGGKFEKRSDLINAGLAKRWVLEGGTLLGVQKKDKWLASTRRGFPGTAGKLKSGKQRSFGFSYGDPVIRADAKEGYGIVPMPGITTIDIKTKSAYGSLREAKVSFQCHNQRQLEILELLYMRPGYPLLLEWGWTTYIGNDGKRTSEFPYITEFFNNDVTQEYVNREIIKNKAKTGGNYDALMAICKNFKYTARPDGGYDCETEMVAVGEVIESIKSTRKAEKDEDGEWKEVDKIESFLELALAYNEYADWTKNDSGWGSKAFWFDNPFALLSGESWTLADKYEKGLLSALPQVDDDTEPTLYPWIMDGNTKLKNDKGEELDNDFNGCYIRWDALAHLFNVRFIPKNPKDGSPLFSIQTNSIINEDRKVERKDGKRVKPLLYNRYQDPLEGNALISKVKNRTDLDISLDPSVGLLPHQLDELKVKDHNLGRLILGVCAVGFVPTMGVGIKMIADEFRKMTADPISKDVEDRMIGKIYFNVQRLLDTYKSMRYDSEGMSVKDFNLYDYIKRIWDQLDDACAGTHNFELITDHERGNLVKVVDLSFNAGKEEGLDLSKIVKLNIQSNDSIVRDFSYHTSIPSAMTSTIAVAAQSPTSIDSIEQTSFAALHRAIKNRFTIPDEKEVLSKEQKEKLKEQLKDKQEAARDLWDTNYKYYVEGMAYLKEYSIEILEGDYAKINDSGESKSQMMINIAKANLRGVISAAEYLDNHHSKNTPEGYKGQPYSVLGKKSRSSAIIPLKFQATMDGIGGIIIGNVFQIQPSRLPKGYKHAEIAFVVTGESQTITAGGDWTTEITGQMILLPPKPGDGGTGLGEGGQGEEGNLGDPYNELTDNPSTNDDVEADENSEQQNQLENQNKCPQGQHWDEELQTCLIDDVVIKEEPLVGNTGLTQEELDEGKLEKSKRRINKHLAYDYAYVLWAAESPQNGAISQVFWKGEPEDGVERIQKKCDQIRNKFHSEWQLSPGKYADIWGDPLFPSLANANAATIGGTWDGWWATVKEFFPELYTEAEAQK